jgi:hypothetical protein
MNTSPAKRSSSVRMSRMVFGASGVLVGLGLGLLIGVSGCEERPTTPPAPQGGGLSQNPTSLPGRSAKTGRDVGQQAENRDAQAGALAGELSGETTRMDVGGLSWPVPTAWRKVAPASNFVAAEYRFDGAGGEGRVTVSTFANGSGGSVDMNVTRWEGQFAGAVTSPIKREVAGCKVTLVSLDGTLKGQTPGGPATDTENMSLRGAIVEGPQGLVVVKMMGPTESVREAQGAWDQLVQGMVKK